MAAQSTNSSYSYMCECRLTHNYFVHSVGMHFEYRGDDNAFAQRYASALGARVTLEAVLVELRKQREERLQAADASLQRVLRIEKEYTRLHPEVYSLQPEAFLHEGFREIVETLKSKGSPAIRIMELKSKGRLQELRPGLWSFPVLSDKFCALLEAELAHFRASGLPFTAPNSMNRHGLILAELGFYEGLLDPLVYQYVDVIAGRLLSAHTDGLDSYRGFTVLYDAAADGDRDLALHYDNAEVTLNINIGGEWEGGQVAFYGLATEDELPVVEVALQRGHGVLHAGLDMHKALPITSGTRHNLILWCRSSCIRNDLCPMCFKQPRLVPTNRYHHEGFTMSMQDCPPPAASINDDDLYD